jgi:hypothetical protein
MAEAAPYPVTFDAVYPERLSRLSTFFRLLLFIPIAIFAAVLGGGLYSWGESARGGAAIALGTAGAVALASWLAILVRGRIPRWLFDFQVAFYRWANRAFGYFLLLTDRYPPFEGDWVISYDVRYPERVSRWKLLFWKIITAIPHLIILEFLGLGAMIVTVIAWFFILFSGRYPRGLFDYVAGVMRWGARVWAYVLSLTDEYPPFNLSAGAGRAGGDAYLISTILGFLLAGGAVAGGVTLALIAGDELEVQVNYRSLQAGTPANAVQIGDVMVALTSASDPLSEDETLLEPDPGRRLVMFEFSVANEGGWDIKIEESDFKLWDEEGKKYGPELVVVAGHPATQDVKEDRTATVAVVFELPEGVEPAELGYEPSFAFRNNVKYVFR